MAHNHLTRTAQGIPFRYIPEAGGLARLLGPLEITVMTILWERGPLKVRAVYNEIRKERDLAYTTIMTTCGRLAEKGLLERTSNDEGYSYVYTPTLSEAEFVRAAVRHMVDSLVVEHPELVADGLREAGYLVTPTAQLPRASQRKRRERPLSGLMGVGD